MATIVGSLVALWRYPIKSMMGEELNSVALTEGYLLGDRQYALTDPATGKVASAKNPRKWSRLFEFRASFTEPPQAGKALPPVRVTLPDGSITTTSAPEFNALLSRALEREVTLQGTTMVKTPSLEEYWPEVEGLAFNDALTDEAMPSHTFFDLAPIHILTTATIDQLRALYHEGRFEARRFRPNIVIEPTGGEKGFLENDWIDRMLAIGDEVRLSITAPCPRCVMTTLPQGDLPRDLGILRTAARYNNAEVGVYASVLRGGIIRRGDPVVLL